MRACAAVGRGAELGTGRPPASLVVAIFCCSGAAAADSSGPVLLLHPVANSAIVKIPDISFNTCFAPVKNEPRRQRLWPRLVARPRASSHHRDVVRAAIAIGGVDQESQIRWGFCSSPIAVVRVRSGTMRVRPSLHRSR